MLVVADFNIRMAMWDLRAQTCRHRTGPKFATKGILYSRDGQCLAVAEVWHPVLHAHCCCSGYSWHLKQPSPIIRSCCTILGGTDSAVRCSVAT